MNATITSARTLLMMMFATTLGCDPLVSVDGEDEWGESESSDDSDDSLPEDDTVGVPPDLGGGGDGDDSTSESGSDNTDGDTSDGETCYDDSDFDTSDGDTSSDDDSTSSDTSEVSFCGDGVVDPNELCDPASGEQLLCDNNLGMLFCLPDCTLDDTDCDCEVGTQGCPCKPGDVCGEGLACMPGPLAAVMVCKPIDACVAIGEPCLAVETCCGDAVCTIGEGADPVCH